MKRTRKTTRRNRAKLLVAFAAFVVLFVLVNFGVALRYHSRMYPGSMVLGVPVGNVSFTAAKTKVRQQNPLPDSLKLSYQGQKSTVKTADLGMYIDVNKLPAIAQKNRGWVPVFSLFMHHTLPAPVRIDQGTYNNISTSLASTFHQAPTPAHIVWQNNQFQAVQAAAGYQLNTSQLQTTLLQGVTHGDTITIPITPIAPVSKMAKPDKSLQAVKLQLGTSITFQFNGKSSKASPQDIASWYTQSGNDFTISPDAVRASVARAGASLGVTPQNIDQAAANTINALQSAHASDVKLFSVVKTFHYCVALRGVDSSNLGTFEQRIAATYADSRGWSLGGQVVFKQVSSGCDYTVWLTAANQMPTFGDICDFTWSCTINNNVVINYDRWQNATTSWNDAHAGTLDEYRAMAINHETGHQLGFVHSVCTTPGGPAPLMEQQSIDLHGCVFNAWPLPSEQDMLRASLGL